MDRHLKIFSRRDLKPIFRFIKEQWGINNLDFLDNYAFKLVDETKLYIINREVFNLNFDKLNIATMGIYFGDWRKDELKLSIEGSQMIGKNATKNILDISKGLSRLWLRGFDLELETTCEGIVLIRLNNDFLGCGRVREGKIFNFIPYIRRIKSED